MPASRFRLGATRRPESAAKVVPITQAQRLTRSGLSPVREIRLGSSTTARMAIPRRANRKKAYRPPTSAIESRKMIVWSQPMFTPPIRYVMVGR